MLYNLRNCLLFWPNIFPWKSLQASGTHDLIQVSNKAGYTYMFLIITSNPQCTDVENVLQTSQNVFHRLYLAVHVFHLQQRLLTALIIDPNFSKTLGLTSVSSVAELRASSRSSQIFSSSLHQHRLAATGFSWNHYSRRAPNHWKGSI